MKNHGVIIVQDSDRWPQYEYASTCVPRNTFERRFYWYTFGSSIIAVKTYEFGDTNGLHTPGQYVLLLKR